VSEERRAESGYRAWTEEEMVRQADLLAATCPHIGMGVHSCCDAVASFIAGVLLEGEPRCVLCGCTAEDACEGGCSWVEDPQGQMREVCSRCGPWLQLIGMLRAEGVTTITTPGGGVFEIEGAGVVGGWS
jgi:hypothetical protein